MLKNNNRSFQITLSLGLLFLAGLVSFDGLSQTYTINANGTVTATYSGSGTFTLDAGVTSITVEAWGGGGAGGGETTNNKAGGGAGGTYVWSSITAASLSSSLGSGPYTVTVGGTTSGGTGAGSQGNFSWFGSASTVYAPGGAGGATGALGAGGIGSTVGTIPLVNAVAGSNGSTGSAGGGGAGGNGANGTSTVSGSTTAGGAGGGTQAGNNNGNSGSSPGGGGGGANRTGGGNKNGGQGAAGQINITYFSISAAASGIACASSGAVFTVSSTTLQTGTYTVTYNVTGTSNNVSSTTATLTFTAGTPGNPGTPGTGTFTTASLGTAESDVLNITGISGGSVNQTGLTVSTNFTVYSCRSWYSYKTGNFNDYKSWTLDPSGTAFYNGLSSTPSTGDNITILNGKTISYNINNLTLNSATIQSGGTLDMVATTGHNLGTVTGQGLLRVKGTALPSGTYTDFVSTTGGTNEYYDVGGTLPTTQTTYNNLKFTNSGSSTAAITFIEASDLTVNGTLTVGSTGSNTATWQINDGSNNQRMITLNGDLNVASNGAITVLGGTTVTGTTSTPHAITMYGNFINNGTVRFFDNTASANLLSDANWNATTTPTSGITAANSVFVQPQQGFGSTVTFTGTSNQTVTCNGVTYFYNLTVNKGTSLQPILNIYSSNVANFRLYGPANSGSTDGGQTTNDGTGNTSATSVNALSIANGTLELTGSITIPILEVGTTVFTDNHHNSLFSLPQTAELWVNSANVSVTVADLNTNNGDQRFLIQGTLRVTNGTFNTGYSKGLATAAAGVLMIEGGTINTWQFRPATVGQQNFSYVQLGGTVNIGTIASIPTSNQGGVSSPGNQYARFSILAGTFQMSGGVLNIGTPSQYTSTGGSGGGGGAIDIQSPPGNYNVTGGTVNVYIPSAADPNGNGPYTAGIWSKAPLGNLNIYKDAGANTSYAFLGQSLTVLNNLNIDGTSAPTFICNNNNLTIGGNFTINNGSTFSTGTTTTGATAAGTGAITFNGTGAQTWTYSSTGTVLTSNTVIVSKTAGTVLSVASGNTLPSIGTLTLTSGTFNDNGSTVTVTTGLTNNATHTSTGTGSITYSAVGGTIAGNNGTFGNLILSGNGSVTGMSGNQMVTGDLRLTGTGAAATPEILNIGSNNLTVSGAISTATTGTTANFGHNVYILTSGLHNAGGLTRPATANTDVTFPLGTLVSSSTSVTTTTNRQYTPNTINVSSATTYGSITVRPVSSYHPNVTVTNASLAYYWRVTSSGFVLGASPTITHKTYQFADGTGTAPTEGGTTSQYVAARYDRSNNSWAYFIGSGTAAAPQAQTMTQYILAASTASPYPFNTAITWTTGVTGSQLDGEYTCGYQTAFGATVAYYSMNNGNWDAANVWTSSSTHSGVAIAGPPCATCPVVIGDGASINHTITITANGGTPLHNLNCGSVAINGGSTLDCSTFTSLNFGTNTSGTGKLRIASPNFPQGDFTSFLGSSGGTVEWYGNSMTVPTIYTAPNGSSQNLNTYYNLILSATSGQTIILPAIGLTVYNNLTEGSSASYGGVVITNGSAQTIAVGGNFTISNGGFYFTSTPSNSTTTLNVAGNVVNNAGMFVAATSAGQTNTHFINVNGSITNNSVMTLRQFYSGTRYNLVDITFSGTNNATFGGTATGGTTLDLVTVNKGTSQTPTVTFSLGGTLSTTAAAAGWLTLTNGTFDYEYSGSSTVYPTSGATIGALSTTSYTIPSSAKLKVGSGTVAITNASGGTNDLFLNGTLEVAGGTVYTNTTNATGSSNDIEYAAAGLPTIIVSAGSLSVDGSIRRSTSTLTGALVYNQTGAVSSTVTVGGNGSDNTRGVFEIEANTGSSFTMTGSSTLNVQRQTGGTGYADLYINPSTSTADALGTITVGLSTAITQNNFRVNVVPTIGNFTVQNGAGTNPQTVNLYNNLLVGGTLTINSPSSLIATLTNPNANVTIAGDFICPTGASYAGGTNTTTFNGSGAQSAKLTSTTQLYNMTVNKSAGTVTVSGTAPASPGLNNLNILSGTLEVGNAANPLSGTLQVNRNITINGSQIGTQAIEVYSTSGISNTITSSGGSFTNLTLGGTVSSATVAVSGNLGINGTFNLLNGGSARYFNIGSSQLTFGSSSPTPSNASSTSFIRTNGVASDLGVVKNWSSAGTFGYAVGTSTNYTPVSYTLGSVTTAGTITVVPVNSVHNTATPKGSSGTGTDYILNYYWTVTRSSSLVATLSGNFTFQCPLSLRSGSSASGDTFAPGYLDPNALSSGGGWVTNVASSLASVVSNTITLTFPSTPTTDFPSVSPYYYDYSAGTGPPNASQTNATLPNPIKGVYSKTGAGKPPVTAGGGNWTTGSNWTYLANGDPTNSGASDYSNAFYTYPYGLPVTISPGTQINMDTDGQIAYSTTINGTLYNASTVGHNLGAISGTGTFRTATGTFPAGTYTAFVAATGGTIEYSGTTTMNSLSTYNNLVISNKTINNVNGATASTVTMTASNITLNGALTISASGLGSPNVLDDTPNSSGQGNITVAKDFSNGGTFLEGVSSLSITGNMTNTGTFTDVSGLISVGKNWSNTGTFTAGTGTAAFNGTAAQTVSGNNAFSGLTINQTGNVTLSGTNTTTVSGLLTLTSGNIVSSTTNELSLTSTGTSGGGSTSSYVSGPMMKTLTSGSFTAPLGGVNSSSANLYRPVTIANTSASDTWNFQYFAYNPTNDSYSNSSMNKANMQTVSQFEYWVVKPNSSTTGDLTLSYNVGSYITGSPNGIGTNLQNLRVARWGGTQWDLPPGSGTFSQTGTQTSGTVGVTNVTSFSPFTLASTDPYSLSALPIELLTFTGAAVTGGVELNWSTANEVNNNYFIVLRSTNGKDFESIGTVKGNGTTQVKHEYSLFDSNPTLGKNYYRLQQVDFDGHSSSSEVVVVTVLSLDPLVSIYPNPVSSNQLLNVVMNGLQPNLPADIQILNMQGAKVSGSSGDIDSNGSLRTSITVGNLSAGVYILRVQNTYFKFVIE